MKIGRSEKKSDRTMLKAGDSARREDHRVKGVKIGKTRQDRGISHVWKDNSFFLIILVKTSKFSMGQAKMGV